MYESFVDFKGAVWSFWLHLLPEGCNATSLLILSAFNEKRAPLYSGWGRGLFVDQEKEPEDMQYERTSFRV